MTRMGIADWVVSQLPKTALDSVSCSSSVNASRYETSKKAHQNQLQSASATISTLNYCQACQLKKLALDNVSHI